MPELMKSYSDGGTRNSKHRGCFLILVLEVLLPVAEVEAMSSSKALSQLPEQQLQFGSCIIH